ncbi:MAG: enoyl-CoA hydratase-related protein [Ilumatobacteraceae bacterium]
MGDQPVQCQVVEGVATITLDSPANRNALSSALLAGLHEALDRAEQPDVRVIVLGHTPPVFCAGADLRERSNGPTDAGPMMRAMRRLSEAHQPTIAAVQGPVRAGGVGLMASCDLVVVQRDVNFAFTEVRIGVAPAIISVPILQRSPWTKLAAAFLTGETFDAATALDMGLVTHVTDDVTHTVRGLVAGVLQGAPGAVAATKRLLRGERSWDDMRTLSEELFASAEAAEGMSAFAEKRTPRWTTTEVR